MKLTNRHRLIAAVVVSFFVAATIVYYFDAIRDFFSGISEGRYSAFGSVMSAIGAIVVIPTTILWNIKCRSDERRALELSTLHEVMLLLLTNASSTISTIIGVANNWCAKDGFVVQKILCGNEDVMPIDTSRLSNLTGERSKMSFEIIGIINAQKWLHSQMLEYNKLIDELRVSSPANRVEMHKACIGAVKSMVSSAVSVGDDFKRVFMDVARERLAIERSFDANIDALDKLMREAYGIEKLLDIVQPSMRDIVFGEGFPRLHVMEKGVLVVYSHREHMVIPVESLANENEIEKFMAIHAEYGKEFSMYARDFFKGAFYEIYKANLKSHIAALNSKRMSEKIAMLGEESANKIPDGGDVDSQGGE